MFKIFDPAPPFPASKPAGAEKARALLIAAALTLLPPVAGITGIASAVDTPEQAETDAARQLAEIQSAISLSEERREQLREEIREMDGDRTRQNAALIAAAQRVRLTEIEVSDIEQRLEGLLDEEAGIRARLDGADAGIANLLAALQRISANPPPALIVEPSDALNSARSALLLSSILPQLRERADVIIADLRQLETVKNAVLEERRQLTARYSSLFEEQLRIATLIEARKRGIVRITADLAEEEARAQELAEQASSINQLIASLQARIESVAEAAAQADAEPSAARTTPLSAQEVRLALANTQRTSPAFPFNVARGHLAAPAAGVVITDFGADDGFGGISRGVSMVTRADAQVVAPSDGWVMYKGPYLNYGQIIIINPGAGYTILLAGLEEVSVELGQFVLLGEPVGTMGSRTVGQTMTTRAGVSRPTLYIELRDQDTPIDPAPWWTSRTADARPQDQQQDQPRSG